MSNENIEDADLAYTQGMRRQLIGKMTENGKMPEDTKDRSILLQALDGMDRQSLTKIKIKSDEGMNSTKALAAETLANLFMNAGLKKSRQAPEGHVREVLPALPDDLPPVQLVDGELDALGGGDTYDTFMARSKSIDSE